MGGLKYLKHLYLNDYAEFTGRILHMMFLNDFLLAFEISTVLKELWKI